MPAFLILASLAVQVSPLATGLEPARADAEECDFDKAPRAREKWLEQPPPGMVIAPGIVTGMSREQVRQVSPLLDRMRASGSFEFIPGLRTAATALFTKKTKLLYGLYLRGRDREAAKEALTVYFGEPSKIRATGRYIEQSADITGAGRFAKGEFLQWCQAHRVISLSGDEDGFSVWIIPNKLLAPRP